MKKILFTVFALVFIFVLLVPNSFALTQGQEYRIGNNLAEKVTKIKYRFISLDTGVVAYEFVLSTDGVPDSLNLKNVPIQPGTYYLEVMEFMPHPKDGWDMTIFYGAQQDFVIEVGQRSAEVTVIMERTGGMSISFLLSNLPNGFTESEDGWYNIQIFGPDGNSSGSAQKDAEGNLQVNTWTWQPFGATRAIVTDGAGVQWVTSLGIDAVTMASGNIPSAEFTPEVDTVSTEVNRTYAHEELIFNGMDDFFTNSQYQTLTYEVTLEEGKTYDFVTSPPNDTGITPARQVYLEIFLGNTLMTWGDLYAENIGDAWYYYAQKENWECPASGIYTVAVQDTCGISGTGFNLRVNSQD